MMMKKTSKPFIILAAIVLWVACGTAHSPKKTASRFLNAFNEQDYAEARKYATPETIKLVDLMESLSEMSSSADSSVTEKIEVVGETIKGDTAMVTFREVGSEETSEIMLKKVEGKWLVHITKTDIAAKDNSIFNTGEEGLMESDSLEFTDPDSMATIETDNHSL